MFNGADDERFGRMIRRQRLALRRSDGKPWSQENLAEAAGMDQGTISNIEREIGTPTMESVQRLARFFKQSELDYVVKAGLLPGAPVSTLSGGGVLGPIAAQPGVSEEYPPAPNAEGDYDYQEVRRYVESNPNPHLRARLARQEARRTPESYQRLIFRIFKAWMSNVDFGLGEAEEEDDDRPGTDR